MPRGLALIAATTVTLAGVGAVAAPAFASSSKLTPLAQAVQKGHDATILRGVQGPGSGGQDIRQIRILIANAQACDEAISAVSRVPADSAQRAAKALWLSGTSLQAHTDVQIANALIVAESGDLRLGEEEFNAQAGNDNKLDSETGKAEIELGLS